MDIKRVGVVTRFFDEPYSSWSLVEDKTQMELHLFQSDVQALRAVLPEVTNLEIMYL